jgi:hypothetical protein
VDRRANSARKLSVSLGAVRWPRLATRPRPKPILRGCSMRAGTCWPSIFFQHNGEVQQDGPALPRAKLPTSLYHTELAHELPAGPLEDLAAVKVASSDGSMDRAQHPSPTAPNRRSKKLTSRDSLQAEEQTPSIFQYISANCAAMDSTSSISIQRILHPYVFTDFKLQQALYHTEDAIISRSLTWPIRGKRQRQRQSPS